MATNGAVSTKKFSVARVDAPTLDRERNFGLLSLFSFDRRQK
jgi:hypothetical protein